MTSIHEPGQSSPDTPLQGELQRAQAQCAALARRNDELELIVAASRLGFGVLEGVTRRLRANSQFKAEFGWAPDASIDWEMLEERVAMEARSGLADAARAALTAGTDFDLVVPTVWPDGATQWVALHGHTVNDGADHRNLVLTARNVSSEKRAAASEAAERATAVVG